MAQVHANPNRPLSRREREAANLIIAGLSNKEIAQRMKISAHTAKYYAERVVSKLRAANRTHAAALWAVEVFRGLDPVVPSP
jgi:DNA-binding CsgD family transcriptional regulator